MFKYQKFVLAFLLLSFLIIAPLGIWTEAQATTEKHLAVAGMAPEEDSYSPPRTNQGGWLPAPEDGASSPTNPNPTNQGGSAGTESQPPDQIGSGAFGRLTAKIEQLLRVIIRLLFVLATVYFMWGVIAFLRAGGKEDAIAQGRQHMIWGIIGMAVMLGAWGIVRLIRNFLGLY